MDADGFSVLAFKDAQERARTWFEEQERLAAGEDAPTGPYTVADAMTDYLASMESEGKKSARDSRIRAEAMIVPKLGKIEVSKLTTSTIRQWRNTLAQTPARTRTRKGDEQRYRNAPDNPESIRQRRSSANRLLSILKAALNHAFREGKVHSDLAWRRVTPFKKVEAARVRYLSDDESRRLVNACSEPLRSMVIAGFRPGAC
jgi:hypothetical protein